MIPLGKASDAWDTDLIVQMVEETNREQHPVEAGLLLEGDVDASPELGSLKDESSRDTDEAGDECGPGIDARAAQALDITHCPATAKSVYLLLSSDIAATASGRFWLG